MGLAEQFTNLGEDMLASFDSRVNFLGKNVVDTHKFLGAFRKHHKTMARKLKTDLGVFVDDLSETVDKLRHKFRKEQRAVHHECAENHRAWENVAKKMVNKRKNFKAAFTKAKRTAG